MGLSLLCLIGLRRNQIECDNCVSVTFPLRDRQREEGAKLGVGNVHVTVHVRTVFYVYKCVWRSRGTAAAVAPYCIETQGGS